MKVEWVVQRRMLDGPGNASGLVDAIMRHGHTAHVLDNTDDALAPVADAAIVVWGSLPFTRRLSKQPWTPGAYLRLDNLRFSAFAAHYGDYLLSDDYVILPFAEAVRRRLPGFWRPNESTKSFTGMVVVESDFDLEINTMRQVSHEKRSKRSIAARSSRAISRACLGSRTVSMSATSLKPRPDRSSSNSMASARQEYIVAIPIVS